MMDSRYYCFLAVTPSDALGSQQLSPVIWLVCCNASPDEYCHQWRVSWKRLRHMGDLSQGASLPHLFKLGDNSDSRCSSSFLEEPLPGMMLLHWFLAIHFTRSKYSEKELLCRLISSGNVFQQPCQLQRRRWISLCHALCVPDSQLFKHGLFW